MANVTRALWTFEEINMTRQMLWCHDPIEMTKSLSFEGLLSNARWRVKTKQHASRILLIILREFGCGDKCFIKYDLFVRHTKSIEEGVFAWKL